MAQHKKKDLERRIARIHGHVHSIKEMLNEGRSYSEIVHQISAVRASLDSVVQVIVDDLVEDCVAKMKRNEPFDQDLLELQAVVGRLR